MSKTYTVTLITGDGVGPELASAARRCVDVALETTADAGRIDWTECIAGTAALESQGTPMPEATIESVRTTDATLKAPITTPIGTGFRSVNVMLRQALDMYCCLRPCKSYPGVRSKYETIDLVLVRENCEDLYAGVEFEKGTAATAEVIETINRLATGKTITTPAESTGISIKPISVQNTKRIVRFAFEYARAHGRKSVTYVHKANIMKHSDGLFKQVAETIAKDYPDIEARECLIDAMCMHLVQWPERYDVIVTENLYGDILSDLCAGLIGGLGMAPGANIGDSGATFEATHGSAPALAGQDKVNPSALILSAKLMLDYLGEAEAAGRLEAAVAKVIADGEQVTFDMKDDPEDPSAVGTQAMADAICDVLRG